MLKKKQNLSKIQRGVVSQSRLEFVTKIVRDQKGNEFTACFAVTNWNGELCFRLVKLSPLFRKPAAASALLFGTQAPSVAPHSKETPVQAFKLFYKECQFIVSQPTRAPDFVN